MNSWEPERSEIFPEVPKEGSLVILALRVREGIQTADYFSNQIYYDRDDRAEADHAERSNDREGGTMSYEISFAR